MEKEKQQSTESGSQHADTLRRIQLLERDIKVVNKKVEELFTAFPDGVQNHRAAHEAQIKAAKAQEDFYTSLKTYLVTRGLVGAIVILLGLLYLGVQTKLGIPLNLPNGGPPHG